MSGTPVSGPPALAQPGQPRGKVAPLSEAPDSFLSSQEQQTLGRLLKKMSLMTGNERALFTWLLTHDGQWIVAETLAAAVCISKRATRPDRTRHLDGIEFIQHNGARFRATFSDYVKVAFGSERSHQAVKQALLNTAR